eukprot:912516-Rhodomonas_salina.2
MQETTPQVKTVRNLRCVESAFAAESYTANSNTETAFLWMRAGRSVHPEIKYRVTRNRIPGTHCTENAVSCIRFRTVSEASNQTPQHYSVCPQHYSVHTLSHIAKSTRVQSRAHTDTAKATTRN